MLFRRPTSSRSPEPTSRTVVKPASTHGPGVDRGPDGLLGDLAAEAVDEGPVPVVVVLAGQVGMGVDESRRRAWRRPGR